MAKRNGRKKGSRRRRKQGISLLGVAETVALSNAATATLFNVNAYDFIVGGNNFGQQNQITLRELFNPMQSKTTGGGTVVVGGGSYSMPGITTSSPTMSIVQENLRQNWVMGATAMVTIPLAFRLGKQLARPAISRVNALLRKAGVASTVKV